MLSSFIHFLERSPIVVLCIMTVSFLGFGYFSINLFYLFEANVNLINQFGLMAIKEGAALQFVMIVFHAFVSVLFYAVWKVGERLFVDRVVAAKTPADKVD
ncbi:hypothetical protein ACVBE9_03260 [Eionea flava]